jgi:hypothetical protein
MEPGQITEKIFPGCGKIFCSKKCAAAALFYQMVKASGKKG